MDIPAVAESPSSNRRATRRAQCRSGGLIITAGNTGGGGSGNPGLPQPASIALLGAALAGFAFVRRRKGQKAA
ncbi:MAG TPA: VPLPA-CTERM sorting domain-containing protein [Rhizomicrobium sp.]|nr:VPLPA-CTERM sorting domain-containing protein [Rhizomicrobium sp.]